MYQATTSTIPKLGPESYYDSQYHDQDVTRLRSSAWHLIGTTSQLASSGDYIACHVLGVPVVVRRFDEQLVAFRNVCAHRHCQLVDEGMGNATELKCRYHGWQYGSDGQTRRIPGARNFPKFDRQRHRLESFQVDTVGQLIFVRFADCAQTLREWLAEFESPLRFATDIKHWEMNLCNRLIYDANWKIPVEGSLESYHLDEVHAKTFGSDPGEEATSHQFNHSGTIFQTESRGKSFAERTEEASIRWLTGSFDPRYRHIHLFPNLMASLTETITLVYQIEPLSAQQCQMTTIGFGRLPSRQGPLKRMWAWGMRRMSARIAMKIFMEDAKIFPLVQNGKRGAVDHGIFGRCEERLEAFHKHWAPPSDQ
jgi:phenylpropionate dioxygenase-like ring-hydroxylating dioxygenase large terminal subunit